MAHAIWRRSHQIFGSIRWSFHSVETLFSRRASFLIALMGGCVATPALPLSLDPIREQSPLGESLRIVIPVVLQPDEALSEECIRVIPTSNEAREGIPEIRSARVALEQVASSRSIVVTSASAVNEPAMRITLEAGCNSQLRREYVMLFDPPVVNEPVLGTAAPLATNLATGPAPTENAAPPTPAAEAVTFAPPPAAETAPTTPSSASTLKPRASSAASSGRGAEKTAARAPASRRPSKNSGDRLAISRVAHEKDSSNEFATMSKSVRLADVEEQEAILRNRVAELSAMVVRMQQEQIDKLSAEVQRLRREASAAQAAQRAAEEAARMSPWAVLERLSGENWQSVVLMLALVALLAALVWQRRLLPSRASNGTERPLMATGQSGFDVETYTDLAALDAGPSSDPPIETRHPVPVAKPGAHSLQLSEHDRDFDRDLHDHSSSRLNPANA
jgi:TolA-binding protein